MLPFLLKRLALAVVTVFVVSVIAFALVRLSPVTPGAIALGFTGTPETIEAYNRSIGWFDPLVLQYSDWAWNAIRLDFGASFTDGRDVGADIMRRFPISLSLAAFGTLVSAVVGIALGVTAAVRRGIADKIITAVTGIGASLPNFWVGILLVFVFAVTLGVLPAIGYVPFEVSPSRWAASLVLPVATLAVSGASFVARQARASMTDALAQEHIRTLRATGVPTWRILYIHALRYASLPIIASIALQFVALVGGSVIIEQLFAMPGLGLAIQVAVGTADSITVQAIVVFATLVVVLVNLALELLSKFLDPKLRTS